MIFQKLGFSMSSHVNTNLLIGLLVFSFHLLHGQDRQLETEFFYVKLEKQSYKIWDDSGTDADNNVSIWHPEPSEGYFTFGDVLGSKGDLEMAEKEAFLSIKPKPGYEYLLKSPTGNQKIWDDSGSGADDDLNIYSLKCPSGYVALGMVASSNDYSTSHTSFGKCKCIKTETYDGKAVVKKANYPDGPFWTDKGSDADDDVSLWVPQNSTKGVYVPYTFFARQSHSQKPYHTPYGIVLKKEKPVEIDIPNSIGPISNTLRARPGVKQITFDKKGFPLDYHTLAGVRWQHMQDILRLPDYKGYQYYMGTYSQNVSGGSISNVGEVVSDDEDVEGGMVFVAELEPGKDKGKVIWVDTLHNGHQAGGFNHPGDLRLLENVVVIAGQNWDGGDWEGTAKATIAKSAQQVGDAMKEGNGGQAVLFYDISNPTAPNYLGKIDSYEKNGTIHKVKNDIDALQIVKRFDNSYHLWMNAIDNEKGWRLKSNSLDPNVEWEWVNDETIFSAPSIYFINSKGELNYSAVSWGDDKKWILYGTNTGKSYYERIPERLYGNATLNMTTLNDGISYIVYGNVESDSEIEIGEAETDKWNYPITDLYIVVDRNTSPPIGYEKILYDLNEEAGGEYIYLCYTRSPLKGDPITELKLFYNEKPSSGYLSVPNNKGLKDYDLNKNAKGDDIFLGFKRTPNELPITSIDIIDFAETEERPGWTKLPGDLNKNAGGEDLFIMYTKEKLSAGPAPSKLFKNGEKIALQASNGKYLSHRQNQNGNPVHATAKNVGNWETFTVEIIQGNNIALKASNGKYLSANFRIKDHPLQANANKAEIWEAFYAIDLGNGKIALKAANGQFLSAKLNKDDKPLTADRDKRGNWETFTIKK